MFLVTAHINFESYPEKLLSPGVVDSYKQTGNQEATFAG